MRFIRRSLAPVSQAVRGEALPRRAALCLIYAFLIFTVASCTADGRPDQPKLAQLSAPPAEKVKPAETVAPIPTPMETFRALAPPEGMKFTPLFAEPVKDTDARFKRLEDSVQSLRNDFDTVVPTLVRLVAVEKDMKTLVAQLQTLTDQNPAPAMPAVPPPPVAQAAPVMAVTPPPVQPQPAPKPAKETPKPKAVAPKKAPTVAPKEAPKQAAPKQEAPKENPTNAAPANSGSATPLPAAEAPKASAPASPEAAPKGNQSPEGAASLPLHPLPMKNEAVSPDAATALPVVKDVRAGDHGGVTHLVIEMTAKAKYTASLLEGGKRIVIELPDASWTAKPAATIKSSNLVSGYKYEDGKLTVDLSAPAVLKGKQFLSPELHQGYRLVIDLVPAGH